MVKKDTFYVICETAVVFVKRKLALAFVNTAVLCR